MSKRITGSYDDALYKSTSHTFALLYFKYVDILRHSDVATQVFVLKFLSLRVLTHGRR